MTEQEEKELARRRFLWMLSNTGGGLSQTDLAKRYGVKVQRIHDIKKSFEDGRLLTLSSSRYISYLFLALCQGRGLDPAPIDISLSDVADGIMLPGP